MVCILKQGPDSCFSWGWIWNACVKSNSRTHFLWKTIPVLDYWAISGKGNAWISGKCVRPISQSLWADNPNLLRLGLLLSEKYSSDQVTILHMSQQLSSKLWPDLIKRSEIGVRRIFTRFELCAHKLFVKRAPNVRLIHWYLIIVVIATHRQNANLWNLHWSHWLRWNWVLFTVKIDCTLLLACV